MVVIESVEVRIFSLLSGRLCIPFTSVVSKFIVTFIRLVDLEQDFREDFIHTRFDIIFDRLLIEAILLVLRADIRAELCGCPT